MNNNILLYILVSALTVYLIRVLPLTLIKRQITNPYIRSFLYYIPYVTLSVMTFPAIIQATSSMFAGIAALIVGIILAWKEKGLPIVTAACCITVLIVQFLIP